MSERAAWRTAISRSSVTGIDGEPSERGMISERGVLQFQQRSKSGSTDCPQCSQRHTDHPRALG
jgi:hypothetical protein